jgi:pyruvate/2-oxoglutarate/acetoin dehydrogenase E1 component
VAEIEFRAAIREALDEELERDPAVVFFGEDVAKPGGVFAVTVGLYEKYGPDRVFDTPISELALAGTAFGSAVCGLRPVVEIMFADFLPLVMDSLVNQAAKYWYLSNEQASVPLVIRTAAGAGGRFGAVHSQLPITWFQNIPGLKIVCPATPADAKGLLKSAIRGEVDGGLIPLGDASIVRDGADLTIVTAMKGVHEALSAAETLAADGIEVEVVDLRTLRPLDMQTVISSVQKTNRVLVVEEGPEEGGWAGEVLASIVSQSLGDLDDAWRLASPNMSIPYSPPLEDAYLPLADRIVSAVRLRA